MQDECDISKRFEYSVQEGSELPWIVIVPQNLMPEGVGILKAIMDTGERAWFMQSETLQESGKRPVRQLQRQFILMQG